MGGGTEETPDAFEKLPEMDRMPADIGGASSVGLPRPPTLGRDCDFGNGGRQTFCGIFFKDTHDSQMKNETHLHARTNDVCNRSSVFFLRVT